MDAMEREEKRMAEARSIQDQARERKLAAAREEDRKGGKEVVDQKYKALEYLLNQSKLYSAIMLEQMTQQEEAENVRDEKSRQRAAKRGQVAESAARLTASAEVIGIDNEINKIGRLISIEKGSLTVNFVSDLDAEDLFAWARGTPFLQDCDWIIEIEESRAGKFSQNKSIELHSEYPLILGM